MRSARLGLTGCAPRSSQIDRLRSGSSPIDRPRSSRIDRLRAALGQLWPNGGVGQPKRRRRRLCLLPAAAVLAGHCAGLLTGRLTSDGQPRTRSQLRLQRPRRSSSDGRGEARRGGQCGGGARLERTRWCLSDRRTGARCRVSSQPARRAGLKRYESERRRDPNRQVGSCRRHGHVYRSLCDNKLVSVVQLTVISRIR